MEANEEETDSPVNLPAHSPGRHVHATHALLGKAAVAPMHHFTARQKPEH